MSAARYDNFVRDALPPATLQPEFLFDLPQYSYPKLLNAAAELVDRPVIEGDGARIAIRNQSGVTSYADLADCSGKIARFLCDGEELIPGNRVLLIGPNGAMLFASWLGILKAGGVAVTVMPLLRSREIAKIIRKAEVDHAIVDARFIGEVEEAARASGRTLRLLSYNGDERDGYLERQIQSLDPLPAVETERDDPAIIAFTSGTTGEPKGCVQFHRDILIPADGYARERLGLNRDDIILSSAPIAFTFGLGAQLIFPLRMRATAVTLETGSPAALLEAMERNHVTALFTAPTAYREMLATIDPSRVSSLRLCVSAGEHLPAATWQRWRDTTGLALIDGIGATEMMHVFISSERSDIRPGSTGRVVEGYRGCILDPAGVPLSQGTGRLAIKGPTGCRYLADRRQADYVHDGWNVTGDTYRLDEDGYYWYVARSDDMIISSGYNIAAPEVEDALLSHPAVVECAVIGSPCPDRGQVVRAFVVVNTQAGEALAAELQSHVKATIAPYKYPREIVFTDALPKTATGKVQRRKMRLYASDGLKVPK